MKLEISLKRINELMSLFITQIKGEAAMGRTDLNKSAETILIPLLNEVYGWDLKNINHLENNNNYPGIDLVDKSQRICIQVTAETSLKKIKDTLSKFKKYEQYLEYSQLIIFMLKEKQKSYSKIAIKNIVEGTFEFDGAKNIWDYCTLLKEISSFPIDKTSKIEKILESYFGDESSKSGNASSKQKRSERLGALKNSSKASILASLRAVLGNRGLAKELAEDNFFGAVPKSLKLQTGNFSVLIGELGIGKTLILQRIFQQFIENAKTDPQASIPIFIDSERLQNRKTLKELVISDSSYLGDLTSQGGIILLDALDKLGSKKAAIILEEIFQLQEIWPNSTFFVASRPLRCFEILEEQERIQVKPLSNQESYQIIERISGRKVTAMTAANWTESIQEAIRRPLFALILGRYLQKGLSPSSIGGLLSCLVEDTLQQAKVDSGHCTNLLKQLAKLSIENRNATVYIAEIGDHEARKALIDVGLIVEKSCNIFSFPLQILAEWFAAQSLIDEPSIILDCLYKPERLENWRYPLAIAVATFSHEQTSNLLEPIVLKYPAFASEILMVASSRWGNDEAPLPSSEQCGKQIYQAMEAWVTGFGSISKIIAPIQPNSKVKTIGTRFSGQHLQAAWYSGIEKLKPVVDLPSNWSQPDQRIRRIWTQGRSAIPSSEPSWAWRWTLDTLLSNLGRELASPSLDTRSKSLIREAAWRAALAVIAHAETDSYKSSPWFGLNSIPITELDTVLIDIENKAAKNHWIILSEFSHGEVQQNYCLQSLRQEINRLREMDETNLSAPWIGPDKLQGRCLWELYSPQRLQERVEMVYEAALNIYQKIIETYFLNLKLSLPIAATLPARLIGYLSPKSEYNHALRVNDIPRFDWFLEPLIHGEANAVEIHLSEDYIYQSERKRIASSEKKLEELRPESAVWISYPPMGSNLSFDHFFEHSPATALAYSWLRQDLQKVFGLGHFSRSAYL